MTSIKRLRGKVASALAIAALLCLCRPRLSIADEHSSHHAGGFGAGMGGGMGMSGEMMGEHGRRGTPFYPLLMNLPAITPEQRAELERAAQARMDEGARLMSQGVNLLSNAADNRAMNEATRLIREGLDELQSGLAAREALAAGTPPENIALEWFKQGLNLSGQRTSRGALFGLSAFHLFSMAFLTLISAAAVWIYFLRMRRAKALILSLVPGGGSGMGGGAPPISAAEPSAGSPPSSPLPPAQPRASGTANGRTAEAGGAGEAAGRTRLARWSGKLKVLRTFDEAPSVRTFRLGSLEGGVLPFSYLPGQFLNLTATIGGKRVKRSYSIASSPTERDYAEITVKREPFGVMSGYLHEQVKEGDELEVDAPWGRFTFTGAEADSIVLIGGGVGITPLMSQIRYLTARGWPGEIVLLYCFREPADFIFREELEYLQRRNPNLRVVAAATRRGRMPWLGLEGRFTKEIVAYALPKNESYRIHLCGPPPMMEAIRGMLLELGVARDQIRTEGFGTDQRKPPSASQSATGIAAIDAPSTSALRVNGVRLPAASAGGVATVKFTVSGKSAPLPPGKTVLEASEDVGVNIDYSCRVGTCGTCKVRLVSGSVAMEVEEGLDPGDKEQGWILACQAKASADIAVEA